MDVGWIIWNIIFALFILTLAVGMMHGEKLLRSGSWWGGLILALLSFWTILWIISKASGKALINSSAPLQFTSISEGIGRYFLNIINFFIR